MPSSRMYFTRAGLEQATSEVVDRIAAVGIKAAPGIARDEIPVGWEVEFIAEQRYGHLPWRLAPAGPQSCRKVTCCSHYPVTRSNTEIPAHTCLIRLGRR